MKNCPYCNINVGGDFSHCPLCQNGLQGEGEEKYWPDNLIKRRAKKAFKVVNMAVFTVCIICLALDYMILGGEHDNWSPIVVIWSVLLAENVKYIIRKRTNIMQLSLVTAFVVGLGCFLTEVYLKVFWMLEFADLSIEFIFPGLLCLNLVTDGVLSIISRKFMEHSLIYMLYSILFGGIMWLVSYVKSGMPPVCWTVYAVTCCVFAAALIIFGRRRTTTEIKKRMHI